MVDTSISGKPIVIAHGTGLEEVKQVGSMLLFRFSSPVKRHNFCREGLTALKIPYGLLFGEDALLVEGIKPDPRVIAIEGAEQLEPNIYTLGNEGWNCRRIGNNWQLGYGLNP